MEFLVSLTVDLPAVPADQRPQLLEQERAISRGLRAEGTIVRMWRLPGRRASMSVWKATDGTDLDRQLRKFPLLPWMNVDVTALAHHDVEDD